LSQHQARGQRQSTQDVSIWLGQMLFRHSS
jgi:hypothetical protein